MKTAEKKATLDDKVKIITDSSLVNKDSHINLHRTVSVCIVCTVPS